MPCQRGRPIDITIDGRHVTAFEGELLSTVLQAEGVMVFGRKSGTGRPAGFYCGMGICYECLVTVNGSANVRACQTLALDHMVIETGDGRGNI